MLINYYYICEPGVETVAIDSAKDMVTVKGTMDVKELVPLLAKNSNEPSTFSSGQRLCHPSRRKERSPG